MEGEPPPLLDKSAPQGYALGMADGSVRMLPASGQRLLRPIITRAGGEIVTWPPDGGQATFNAGETPTLVPTTPPADPSLPSSTVATPTPVAAAMASSYPVGAVMASSYGPTSPQSLEQRLKRVEEKLERAPPKA